VNTRWRQPRTKIYLVKSNIVRNRLHSRKARARALGVFWFASMGGIAVSLWAHVESLFRISPSSLFRHVWIFQLILFIILVPIVIELFRSKNSGNILRSPQWMQIVLYALLVYYGAHFYFFLYWSASHLSSAATWRTFSSGWLLLFSLSAVYYTVRLEESKRGT